MGQIETNRGVVGWGGKFFGAFGAVKTMAHGRWGVVAWTALIFCIGGVSGSCQGGALLRPQPMGKPPPTPPPPISHVWGRGRELRAKSIYKRVEKLRILIYSLGGGWTVNSISELADSKQTYPLLAILRSTYVVRRGPPDAAVGGGGGEAVIRAAGALLDRNYCLKFTSLGVCVYAFPGLSAL